LPLSKQRSSERRDILTHIRPGVAKGYPDPEDLSIATAVGKRGLVKSGEIQYLSEQVSKALPRARGPTRGPSRSSLGGSLDKRENRPKSLSSNANGKYSSPPRARSFVTDCDHSQSGCRVITIHTSREVLLFNHQDGCVLYSHPHLVSSHILLIITTST
jgi:hypothetical protein